MDRKLNDIPSCPGYKASRDGRIFSATGHELKQATLPSGYRTVAVRIGGRPTQRTVHRLVALAWLPVDAPDTLVVDHIDCDKSNNSADNLRWTTQRENMANENTRRRMRESRSTPEYREQNSAMVTGLWSDPGYVEAQRAAHADKDYVARQSAAKRAMWSDEGFRASYRESIAHRCSSIRCTETGEVFPSIRDAARFAGCNPGTLCRALKTGAKVRGEYTFTKEGR